MSENGESDPIVEKPTEATMGEFKTLVYSLTSGGWYNRNSHGKRLDKERDYILPDGRTMRAYKLMDRDYDTGVGIIFSEPAIAGNGKPYSTEHTYYVFDYGGTHQSVRALDEAAEKRANFRSTLAPDDEEKALQREVGLDQESLERQWELQGIAQTAGVEDISEAELRQLIDEISSLQRTGKLESLPVKDIPAPAPMRKKKLRPTPPYDLKDAAQAAESLIYQNELLSIEPAKEESIAELKQLISDMVANGEVVEEEMDYFEPAQPSYRRARYDLINDDEAEIREFIHPDHSSQFLIILSEHDKKDATVVEKRFYLDKEGKFQLDRVVPGESKGEDDELEDWIEADEWTANKSAGLKMGLKMGLHDVSQEELTRLIGLLKTAEPIR